MCFTGRTCFVEHGLGLGFIMKSQPALIVHPGKRIPIDVPLITTFQNAEFLLIVHSFVVSLMGGNDNVFEVTIPFCATGFIVFDTFRYFRHGPFKCFMWCNIHIY